MKRLPFLLPDFTRTAWASGLAQETWAPIIQRFGGVWEQVERLAVEARLRQAALQMVSPGDLPALTAWAAARGLVVLPVAQEGQTAGYSSTVAPMAAGQPWRYRVLVTRPADAAEVLAAWGHDGELGALLGYPACCRAFFQRVWVRGEHVDTTWAMAEDGTEGPPEANILLRWVGVRLVPHLPCSFQCLATMEFGRALVELAAAAGFAPEMSLVLEMLSWPVEWNALHGIAEVRTPICKVVTRTDATAERLVVQRAGTAYPPEGARGLAFPYRAGEASPLPRARPPHVVAVTSPSSPWGQNGFSSPEAQEEAHAVVTAAARAALETAAGYVLDLGCGNGTLAARIARGHPDLLPVGVELDPDRAAAAGRRLGVEAVMAASISGPWPGAGPYGVVLLMPGRLLELAPEEALEVRRRLAATAPRIVLYAYGDWLERFGGLAALAEAAGFCLEGDGWCSPGVEAARALLDGSELGAPRREARLQPR